ncbi:MAG TPA: NAD(P)H-dependent oxidoreductase [Gemmatimonadaceae bacterium]|nr:NAD(P)H-dependent oxidoreductase [Gemmatimonadaceae bacterium]
MHSASTEPRRVLFLLASARRGGNTEQLARAAAASLPATAEQRWLHLDDYPLAPFRDIRHDVGTYPAPEGHERVLAEATLWATDLVLCVPLYWYSVPASAKLYLDYWSGWMRVPGMEFKRRMAGRRMWGVSVFSDEDPRMMEPLLGTLRLCAEYLAMEWRGMLVGYGSRPGDVQRDAGALERARTYFAS